MNIYGYKLRIERARAMIKKERSKKRPDRLKIKRIEEGMSNLRNKIREMRNN